MIIIQFSIVLPLNLLFLFLVLHCSFSSLASLSLCIFRTTSLGFLPSPNSLHVVMFCSLLYSPPIFFYLGSHTSSLHRMYLFIKRISLSIYCCRHLTPCTLIPFSISFSISLPIALCLSIDLSVSVTHPFPSTFFRGPPKLPL